MSLGKPLVSIITATYNLIENGRAEYIKQAIDSVCSQTYQNIEHIIVDGASTDGTLELIKDLQKDRDNLYLYSEKDNGIYDAFNKGVKHAKGKYIIFLNSDDFYHSPLGIEKCVELLEKDNLDFCFSEAYCLKNNLLNVWMTQPETVFIGGCFCHNTLMCKKELLEKYPFKLYKIAGDGDFIIKLFLNKYKYKELNYIFYTQREGGVSFLSENAEISLKEFRQILIENYSDVYKFSDYELDVAVFFRDFPEKLKRYFESFYDDKKMFRLKLNEFTNIYTKIIPDNELVNDIRKRCNDEITDRIENYLINNIPLLSSTDYFLYGKLLKNDKKLFIDFLLKRWSGIDTCSKADRTKLNNLYKNAYKVYNQRKNINEPLEYELNNIKVYMISPVPVINTQITPENEVNGYYEYVHCFDLKEYVIDDFFKMEEGSYILDCGATIGGSTILLKSYYPNNPVISIEQDRGIFDILKNNIELNKYDDVTPLNAFLSYTDSINSVTIDTLAKDIEKIGLIKLNINGHERFVLDGATETITKHKPNLIIALHNVQDDVMYIPYKLSKYKIPMKFRLKWVEKRVYGIDCLLFVKFL